MSITGRLRNTRTPKTPLRTFSYRLGVRLAALKAGQDASQKIAGGSSPPNSAILIPVRPRRCSQALPTKSAGGGSSVGGQTSRSSAMCSLSKMIIVLLMAGLVTMLVFHNHACKKETKFERRPADKIRQQAQNKTDCAAFCASTKGGKRKRETDNQC